MATSKSNSKPQAKKTPPRVASNKPASTTSKKK